jgi:hypothetical protein
MSLNAAINMEVIVLTAHCIYTNTLKCALYPSFITMHFLLVTNPLHLFTYLCKSSPYSYADVGRAVPISRCLVNSPLFYKGSKASVRIEELGYYSWF